MRKSQNALFGLAVQDLEEITRLARTDLEPLRGARLFLTGGTGFFGKWLLAALDWADAGLDLDLRATVLSRHPARFLQQWPQLAERSRWEFISGDVATFHFPEPRFDYVLHAAADTAALRTLGEEAGRARAIIEGARQMLDLARQGGARRLLNISSGAVYGAAAGRPGGAREEDAVDVPALTPYGAAKREAESLGEASGVNFITARAFAFLGPHLPLDAHYAAGNFLGDALAGRPIRVRGDGTAQRSYLYPTDLVVWLLRILARGQAGRAYNVGSDEAVTTGQLAGLIAHAADPAVQVEIQAQEPQGPQNIYLPSILRAKTELGLEVHVPLQEAIRRTLAFHLQNDKRR